MRATRRRVFLSLALVIAACARPAKPPVVAMANLQADELASSWASRAAPRRFEAGALAPEGCFAWSVARASAACVLGQWHHRRTSPPRVVSFLAAAGEEPQPMPLLLEGEDQALATEPAIVVLSRSRLDVAMREGAFVQLPPGTAVAKNAPPVTVGPFTVSLRSEARLAAFMTFVNVHLGASEPPLIDEPYGPMPCPDPRLVVYRVSPTIVVVERSCRLVAPQVDDDQVTAWVCDAGLRTCR
jgi:hypothetical protein